MSNQMSELAHLGWTQLWQVTIVASVALVLVRVFCRRRPHLAYVLLLLVVVKCLTPPIWSSPVGVFRWTWNVPSWSEESVGSTTIAGGPHGPLEQNPKVVTLSAADVRSGEAAAAHAKLTSERKPLGIDAYLLLTWAGGTVICGVFVIATWLRQAKAIRNSSTLASGCLAALNRDVAGKLGLKRRVRLLVSSESYGPCCYGVVFPSVVLPDQFVRKALNDSIEPVLAHELIHIRRGDTIVALFQVVAWIVWWFHPLIWWTTRQLSREREKCCDEEVLAGAGYDPDKYAQGMLQVLKFKRPMRPAFLASGIRPVDVTKERLEAIMSRRTKLHSRTPWLYWVILMVLTVVVVPGQTHLYSPALASNPSGDTETTDAELSSEKQDRSFASGSVARAHKNAAPKEIESSIRQFFTSMSKRDVAGVQTVLDTRFVAIEAGVKLAGRLNAVVHLVDTANPKEILPPEGNHDMENVEISDVKAETSTTHPTVAAASFTLSRLLDAETLAQYRALLKSNSTELSDAQKKYVAKLIDDKAINTAMFAMLALQDGKWKIICMSFPK